MAGRVAGDEDAGGHTDRVEAAIGNRDIVEHATDTGAVGDISAKTNGRAAVGQATASDADAGAVFREELVGGFLGGGFVEIDAHDVRALSPEAVRGFLADAGAGADHDHDLARQFLLGGHALELRLFQQPILDVEGLLLRQRNIFIDGLGAAHDFDGAIVEFSGHAALRLVLAPRNHAEARDQHDGRIRVAHRRRVGVFALGVVGRVVLAVTLDARGQFLAQRGQVFGLRIPIHVERLDLRAQEMVGARRAEFGETRRVLRVNKTQDLLVVLHGADEPLLARDEPAERREYRRKVIAAFLRRE